MKSRDRTKKNWKQIEDAINSGDELPQLFQTRSGWVCVPCLDRFGCPASKALPKRLIELIRDKRPEVMAAALWHGIAREAQRNAQNDSADTLETTRN